MMVFVLWSKCVKCSGSVSERAALITHTVVVSSQGTQTASALSAFFGLCVSERGGKIIYTLSLSAGIAMSHKCSTQSLLAVVTAAAVTPSPTLAHFKHNSDFPAPSPPHLWRKHCLL